VVSGHGVASWAPDMGNADTLLNAISIHVDSIDKLSANYVDSLIKQTARRTS
jgi:hypothetical protein